MTVSQLLSSMDKFMSLLIEIGIEIDELVLVKDIKYSIKINHWLGYYIKIKWWDFVIMFETVETEFQQKSLNVWKNDYGKQKDWEFSTFYNQRLIFES